MAKQMNKRTALFKAQVGFRVPNSYFKDKKTRQQFWQNANENLLNDFVVTLCYDDKTT